jgi:hypothetical protein
VEVEDAQKLLGSDRLQSLPIVILLDELFDVVRNCSKSSYRFAGRLKSESTAPFMMLSMFSSISLLLCLPLSSLDRLAIHKRSG